MRHYRRTTSCWLIAQALCFCLLLQGSGIAEAAPHLPPEHFVTRNELEAARTAPMTGSAEPAESRIGSPWMEAARGAVENAGGAVLGWIRDELASAASDGAASEGETPVRLAQAGGVLPLPPRLMPAVLAAPVQGQGGPPSPTGLAGGEIEDTPPAEAAMLLEKAGANEIPLVAGWNLISIPLELADPDPAAVFAPIAGQLARVEHNDVCDAADPEKLYDPADPSASDLAAVTPGMGLWVQVTAATLLPLEGTLPAATTVELCPGWNHLGMPTAESRHPYVALSSIAGKWQRVFGHDAFDGEDPWEVFSIDVPDWANDLREMRPGYGYWVLALETATLTISNQGPPPTVAIAAPADLAVVTQPTEITGTVDSDRLASWTLTSRPIGDGDAVTLATGNTPVAGGPLATFDPTLLLNGLYELELTATDVQGQQVSEQVAVAVEGQMKIGHFTLSFVDLAIPVSGLDIEVVRTYDSRENQQRDFGIGWSLDIRQGSYRNNRPPGDGWQLQTGFLPCDTVVESKIHLTVVRLSDQEVYRFALKLADGAATQGGCFAAARFVFVDGPLPGTSLEILGNSQVFYENGSDRVIDANTLELYEPEDVRLTTRDGRIFELDLSDGVTRLEDLNGNQLSITPVGITHSSGKSIAFDRDAEGRIERITDPLDRVMSYAYDAAGDLIRFNDRVDAVTRFAYDGSHRLVDIEDPRGVKPIRNDYDAEGRLVRHIDAFGKVIAYDHQLSANIEIMTDRLGHSRSIEYDTRGNVIRAVSPLGAETLRTFDERDNILTETDPLGQVTVLTYNELNDLSSVTDPLGNKTTFTYDGSGRMLTVTNPLAKVTTNVYDSAGNLVETTDPAGAKTTYTYDASGNLLSQTDALGNVSSFAYDDSGNPVAMIDALGNERSYSYDAAGNRLTETAFRSLPSGATETLVTSRQYDALDRLTQTTLPDGGTGGATYDIAGQVISTDSSAGFDADLTYDHLGRQTEVTYVDGTGESRSYDAEGRLNSFTDRAGRATGYLYDAAGRLVRTTFPDGTTTHTTYDLANRVVTTTDPRGNTTTNEYDAAGRLVKTIDAAIGQTNFLYDAASRLIGVTDPRRLTTSFTYDDAGRRIATTFPDGTTRTVSYDLEGRKRTETDPAGNTTRFDYDALGRLTTVTDAMDQTTFYTYNELGDRLTQTDANGNTTRFEYDSMGRQTARVLPDGARETMSYDGAGDLVSRTDFAGRTTSFSYDSAHRLITRMLPGGESSVYSYTPTGRRSSVTNATGTTSYTYDARDRLASMTTPDGRRLSYGYDAAGNRISLTAQVSGQTLESNYHYDALSRLSEVTDPEGRVYTYSYDGNGNRTSLTYPNGLTTTATYDAQNRLTELSVNKTATVEAVASYEYTLGPSGKRTRIDELSGMTRHYGYDEVYRLTTEEARDGSATIYETELAYDPVGNRLLQEHTTGETSVPTTYTYDQRDRLLGQGGTGVSWDANGNLGERMGEASYTWDVENRLASVTLATGEEVSYGYDADGVRVRSEASASDGSTVVTSYLVDSQGPLSQVVAETDGGGNLRAYYLRGDGLLAVQRPSAIRYYHTDGLGSVRLLTDEAADVTDRYTFTAFGELIDREGEDPNGNLFAGEHS